MAQIIKQGIAHTYIYIFNKYRLLISTKELHMEKLLVKYSPHVTVKLLKS